MTDLPDTVDATMLRPDPGGAFALLSHPQCCLPDVEDGPPAEGPAVDPHRRLDALEGAMLDSGLPVVDLPVEHAFFPGLYRRTIFMPAGTLLTSKIHNTKHPYVVLSGRVRVALPGEPAVELTAGHQGTTMPGTRRLLYIVEDCRWATFHPLSASEELRRAEGASEDELLVAIEKRVIERHLLPDGREAAHLYRERLLEDAQAAGLLSGHDFDGGTP